MGTSKVCALIGEVRRDGGLTIIGKGTMPATGLKKGVVVNIDQTVHSIAQAVEQAERLSGMKIDRAFVAVGGQHVESQNSPGTVAVSGHDREVTREDINRATEVARAILEACVLACRLCAEECSRHTDMEHCRVCADACRACEQSCQRVLAALPRSN